MALGPHYPTDQIAQNTVNINISTAKLLSTAVPLLGELRNIDRDLTAVCRIPKMV